MALDQTYLQVSDGNGDASLMHITGTRLIGSTVINVDTVVNVPSKFIATSGTPNIDGFIDPTTVTNFYGHVDGSTLVIEGFCAGSTDTGNTTAQVVIIKPNTEWANLLVNTVNNSDGWNPVSESWSYASADSPTFTVTTPTGSLAKYSEGMKVKLTQLEALTSYWNLDGNSTDTKGSNNGTDTAITYSAGNGKFVQGAGFNGSTSKIVIADAANLKPTGPFTIGAWIKTSTANKAIFQSWSKNTKVAGLFLSVDSNGFLNLQIGNNNGTGTLGADYTATIGATSLIDGSYHYVVATFKDNFVQLYVDGKLDGSGYSFAPVYAATNYVRIGCRNDAGSDSLFFNGAMDDIFLINGYALDERTISLKYAANSSQSSSDIPVVKYGIVTAVTDTSLSVYCGTDHAISNSSISSISYSTRKSPYRFPLSPNKWSIYLSDQIMRSQSSPTQDVWYNVGSLSVSIPIGIWDISYRVEIYADNDTSGIGSHFVSLSKSASSATIDDLTFRNYASATGTTAMAMMTPVFCSIRAIVLNSKTSFYLITKNNAAGVDSIRFYGSDGGPTVIKAVCSYL